MTGGDFIATGDLIRAAVGGKWDNPTGAYNVALKENLVKLSKADNWAEAREEWKATGNVWYVPMRDDAVEVLPEPHKSRHPHECVCSHKIAWHFEIENTENGIIEIVGSEHIGFWMIVRHLIENLNVPADMITEEKVAEWITEAVKSMKQEWWWKEHGEDFKEWFDEIKEIDLIINSREGQGYWDNDTAQYEKQLLIRKKAEGKMGNSDYKMASIVWRWNHPDNSKAQINTRGYPNDRLWNDLIIFYFNRDKYKAQIAAVNAAREAKIQQVIEDKETQRVERERLLAERNERNRLRNEAHQVEAAEQARLLETAFTRTCDEWGIPEFAAEVGRNEWEVSFLNQMIPKLVNMRHISEKQKNRVIKIVNAEDDLATEKQLAYIRKLGGIPDVTMNKRQASEAIDLLKNPPKTQVSEGNEE